MVMLKACLNGGRARSAHPAIPVTPAEVARDAAAVVQAGADAIHVHPRGPDERETLAGDDVAAALVAIRRAVPGVPVGSTTAAWIEADPDRRLALVGGWRVLPDFASVNFDEPGSVGLARLLLDRGVGVEAGLSTVVAVEALLASGLAGRCVRLLLEPGEPDAAAALANAAAMRDALGDAAAGVPVRSGPGGVPVRSGPAGVPALLHGEDAAAWPVLAEAGRLGLDTRVGLEDCLTMPGGEPAPGNAALIEAAVRVLRGTRPVS